MIKRCEDPQNEDYKNYGGRGITVDPRWKDFNVFLKEVGMRPSKFHSLDRIDNDKGYFKENCRWATSSEQNKNRRASPSLPDAPSLEELKNSISKSEISNRFTLREWMFKKKISITFLSALLHVDRTYIHKLMKGQKIPSDKLMEKFRELSLNQIFEKEDLIDAPIKRTKKIIPSQELFPPI